MVTLNKYSKASVLSALRWFNINNQVECLEEDGNEACGDAEDIPYIYDCYGNLLHDGVKTYSYITANRMTSAGGVAYTWDDNGNLLSDGASSGRLRSPNTFLDPAI